MAGVNLLADDVPQKGRNLLADENEVNPQAPGSSDGFVQNFKQGFGGTSPSDFADESLNVKAGGIIFEKMLGITDAGQELVDFGRETDKLLKWRPMVAEAKDKLNIIKDKNTPEYQAAWENVQTTRKNMEDDLAGKFEPEQEESINLDQMFDTMRSNPGTFVGAMAKALVSDPALLLIPGGMVKAGSAAIKATKNASKITQVAAKLAAEAGGAASIGVPLGATADVIDQLDQSPDQPIDFDRVKDTAITVGVISAALPFATGAAKGLKTGINKGITTPIGNSAPVKKIGELMDTRKVRAVEKDAQKLYLGALSEEGIPQLNKEAAVQRSVEKHRPTPEVLSKIDDVDMFMSDVAIAQRASAEANKGVGGKAVDIAANAANKTADAWNDLTQPVTSRLRQMGLPHIAKALNEHDMNVGTDIQRKQEVADSFSKAFAELTESQRAVASINIGNSSFKAVKDQFSPEFNKAFDDVRNMLDGEHEDMLDVGMKVGKTDNYFPREITDYDEFLKQKGVEPAAINKELAKAINQKLNLQAWSKMTVSDMTPEVIRRHLNEKDIAVIVNKHAQRLDAGSSVSNSTNNLASRSVEEITPDQLGLYADPRAALHNHINRVTVKIHDRRFFGGKKIDEDIEAFGAAPDDESLISAYIKDHSSRLVDGGDLLPGEQDKVVDLLSARFVGAKRRAKPIINNTKNILYTMTLGNPIAASTQLGDLGAAAYMNGYVKGVNSIVGDAIEGTRFRMAEFGLDAIPEIESMGKTKQVLDWSLRKGGFQAMDRLGKETILNSTYKKLRSVINSNQTDAEKFKFFKDRYGERLGQDEVQKIMDGVASGDPTNHHARLAMYSDLTRVQPVSMSEMPVAYLNNPNMRIFFMLKTFTLKQIDLMRNEVINEIKTGAQAGDKRKIRNGALNLAKLAGTIGAANMGVDWTKRWMTGKETDLPDVMIDTALRNYGLSTYTTNQILRGNISATAAKIAAPPLSVVDNIARGVMGLDKKNRWIDTIPVVGRTFNFGKQVIDEHF